MISACIITFNVADRLQKLINNIKNGVDEIVIVDSFSSDNTPIIAKKNKVKFFQCALNNDFGSQRNFAIKQAKGDWIFMIDSDELCSKKLIKNMKLLTKIADEKGYDGLTILWKNYCNNNLVEIPRKLILFKRYGYYIHNLHEKVHGLKKIANVKDEKIYIAHYKTRDEQFKKLERYKSIIEENLKKATENNDIDKIAYFKEAVRRQKEKEVLWLNDYI